MAHSMRRQKSDPIVNYLQNPAVDPALRAACADAALGYAHALAVLSAAVLIAKRCPDDGPLRNAAHAAARIAYDAESSLRDSALAVASVVVNVWTELDASCVA